VIIPLASDCRRTTVNSPNTSRHNHEHDQTMNTTLSAEATAKVQEILMEQLGVERDQITEEAKMMEDLGADSLDMVEIAMKVEETFNLTIPDEDMEKIQTVGDLHEALAAFLERTGQPA
jgi:acyl carrier protein